MSSFPVSQERNAFQEQLHSLLQANYLALDSKGKPTAISFAQSLLEKGKALMDPNACDSFLLNEAIVEFLSANQKLYHATNIAEVKKLAEKANLHTSSNDKHKKLYHGISLSYYLARHILSNQRDIKAPPSSLSPVKPLKEKKVKKGCNPIKVILITWLSLPLIMSAGVLGADAVYRRLSSDQTPLQHSFLSGRTNAYKVETATDQCIATWNTKVGPLSKTQFSDDGTPYVTVKMCCNGISQSLCRREQKEYIEETLARHPYAKFQWFTEDANWRNDNYESEAHAALNQRRSQELDPFTKKIKEDLLSFLAAENDRKKGQTTEDPQKEDKQNIVKKLFIDLPDHCVAESNDGLKFTLDNLYDHMEEVLDTKTISSLWRAFAKTHHPDKGGDGKVFARATAVHDCLQHRAAGRPSCVWEHL